MKNVVKTVFGVLVLCSITLFAKAPKYTFVFIGDGMSVPQRMVAEEFAIKTGKGKLAINHMSSHATTRTCSATSLVTDSAAAGTAIACGVKTYNGAIGVDADKNKVESMAEAAKAAGKKVGIVTTVTIVHATPASFYAHRQSRGLIYQIGLDLINSSFDYFAGGGFGGRHNDKKDKEYCGHLFELAEKKGYKHIMDVEQFRKLTPADGKVIYSVDKKGPMDFSIDSDGSEPTIAELTSKGIELLDNPEGFFMMVEGGKIDYAGHGNDAATNIKDLLALNDAVVVAMEFAKKHPDEVLIVVTGDHETGGMTMGVAGTGYALHVDRLNNQKCSVAKFDKIIKEEQKRIKKEKNRSMKYEEAIPFLEKWFGFVFSNDLAVDDAAAGDKFAKKGAGQKGNPMVLNKKEREMLEDGFEDGKLANAARVVINNKSGVGWTTGAHTALPVLTTSYGAESSRFSGFLDNTDIGNIIKNLYKGK
jgi:alkaline phosphatase